MAATEPVSGRPSGAQTRQPEASQAWPPGRRIVTSSTDVGATVISQRRLLGALSRRACVTRPFVTVKALSRSVT